jgi:hypothetical protein
MGPILASAPSEIIGVGLALRPFRRLGFDPIGDAVTLGIGNGLLLALEGQAQLLLHIGGRGPAHERLGHLRELGLIFEQPKVRLAFAGLNGIASGKARRNLIVSKFNLRQIFQFPNISGTGRLNALLLAVDYCPVIEAF